MQALTDSTLGSTSGSGSVGMARMPGGFALDGQKEANVLIQGCLAKIELALQLIKPFRYAIDPVTVKHNSVSDPKILTIEYGQAGIKKDMNEDKISAWSNGIDAKLDGLSEKGKKLVRLHEHKLKELISSSGDFNTEVDQMHKTANLSIGNMLNAILSGPSHAFVPPMPEYEAPANSDNSHDWKSLCMQSAAKYATTTVKNYFLVSYKWTAERFIMEQRQKSLAVGSQVNVIEQNTIKSLEHTFAHYCDELESPTVDHTEALKECHTRFSTGLSDATENFMRELKLLCVGLSFMLNQLDPS